MLVLDRLHRTESFTGDVLLLRTKEASGCCFGSLSTNRVDHGFALLALDSDNNLKSLLRSTTEPEEEEEDAVEISSKELSDTKPGSASTCSNMEVMEGNTSTLSFLVTDTKLRGKSTRSVSECERRSTGGGGFITFPSVHCAGGGDVHVSYRHGIKSFVYVESDMGYCLGGLKHSSVSSFIISGLVGSVVSVESSTPVSDADIVRLDIL